MKLVSAEYSFDGSKVLFFFTSEGRVDFRALVKDLASTIHTRIELRQIGVRDEAKMLGGLGICGRPFCCSQFLDDFQPVSIKMAKTQNLSLNPTKISGTCGRLMCCLKYEQDAYEDLVKHTPKQESFVETPDGVGTVCGVNLLRQTVQVRLDSAPETPKCYHNCEPWRLPSPVGRNNPSTRPLKRKKCPVGAAETATVSQKVRAAVKQVLPLVHSPLRVSPRSSLGCLRTVGSKRGRRSANPIAAAAVIAQEAEERPRRLRANK